MHKTYNTILLSMISILWVVMLTALYFNEPLDGDLTRIGGYKETEYGWNQAREVFATSLFSTGQHINDYNRYYDVIVLGDSFTFSNHMSWLNYFVERTGYSALAMHFDQVDIDDILNSPHFISTPPQILVYESVERSTIHRLLSRGLSGSRDENDHTVQNPEDALLFRQIETLKHYEKRKTKWASLETGLSDVASYFQRRILRHDDVDRALEDENTELVLNLELKETARGLFSSRNQSDMLVIKGDLLKQKYTDEEIKRAGLVLHDIHHAVALNGITRFSALIFPDKLTVYEDYLEDQRWRGLSVLEPLSKVYNLLRLDRYLKQANKDGKVDVYNANNTHTGSTGNRIASDSLIDFLNAPSDCGL